MKAVKTHDKSSNEQNHQPASLSYWWPSSLGSHIGSQKYQTGWTSGNHSNALFQGPAYPFPIALTHFPYSFQSCNIIKYLCFCILRFDTHIPPNIEEECPNFRFLRIWRILRTKQNANISFGCGAARNRGWNERRKRACSQVTFACTNVVAYGSRVFNEYSGPRSILLTVDLGPSAPITNLSVIYWLAILEYTCHTFSVMFIYDVIQLFVPSDVEVLG